MSLAAVSLWLLVAAPETRPETRLEQVAPANLQPTRTPDRSRAVLLIHGLRVHPIHKEKVPKAEFHVWQLPNTPLVKKLAVDTDVFAFAYGQNVAADSIADTPDLRDAIALLKRLGYKEIVLVGHSAGGLIAREFVEDNPDSGVTKVIQVCTPNAGASLASWPVTRSVQRDFMDSLTHSERRMVLKERAEKTVPPGIEFVCVVGNGLLRSDGLVAASSQWTEDLRRQGIPAIALAATHREAIHGEPAAELLSRLVREPQPRWDERKVASVRKELLGK